MVIGSGPIVIGQAAEFDYAGTQACRSLKEEGVEVILVNSNPATIMTDKDIADKVYIEPLNVKVLEQIIEKEKPDSILPTLGGQAGLNLGMELEESGFLAAHNVKLLGTTAATIRNAEGRQEFKDLMERIGEPCAASKVVENVEDGVEFTNTIGYPVVLRPAYTLGGSGGGIAHNQVELEEILENGLRLSRVGQVLVERCIAGWNYIDGCMILALLEIYNATGEKKYYEFADAFIDHRVQEDGTITKYSVEEYNIDNVNAGKTLFALYALNGKEKYRKAIDLIYSQVETQPRTEEGNFWHKKIYPNQVWLDGMYMGQPFYMEYETKFDDKKHYDDIFHQFANVVKYMRDPKTGLYYHGYDASKKAFWCNKETGLSQNFWLRALGWYSMALLDTLSKCEPGEEYKAEYDNLKKVFVDLIDSMLKFQDESGMWYQLPALGGQEPNYLETSGSAIMAYSLLKGVRLGFLPESYRAYGLKAFQGICDRYLKEKDGHLSLGGICLVAGLGPEDNRRRDGSFEYYMSEPIVEDDAKGVGPLLLAYTEMRRLDG